MDQLQDCSKGLEKARVPSRTGNIQRWRQSLFIYHDVEIDPSLTCYLRAEIVRWVSESARPFKIVEDYRFQSLMKTGRPGYYIPSASTVSHDVQMVFARTRQRIANMLRVSRISLAQALIILKGYRHTMAN